jgi:hypothetical protein
MPQCKHSVTAVFFNSVRLPTFAAKKGMFSLNENHQYYLCTGWTMRTQI